ncbi:hypothetical protein A4X09_0g6592 [Tilletia walkeri]|uniref:Uncharacterized protein n=1 Tax=Tilletia walkeri TaxID=117179 RepID=A0A8X7T279_9BASI|nr:hypothetical protein A4X09_0g6592 [Tilletia walkeri]
MAAGMSSSASMGMLPAFHALTQQQQQGASAGASLPAQPTPPQPQPQPQPQIQPPTVNITKKINARLQLAAALIEADNEDILKRAESQAAQAKQSQAAQDDKQAQTSSSKNRFLKIVPVRTPSSLGNNNNDQDDNDEPEIGPSPLPQPRLASQSVIFAPFRDAPLPTVEEQRAQKADLAGRLSRLEYANGSTVDNEEEDGGRRPSIDFLGVTLPTERRARSRTNSIGGQSILSSYSRPGTPGSEGGRPRSRLDFAARSLVDEAQTAEQEVDALSEWGVDKFLTTDERERVKSARMSRVRTLSDAGDRPLSAFSNHSAFAEGDGGSSADTLQAFTGAFSSVDSPQHHARSEFATEATGIPSFDRRSSAPVDEDPSGFPVPRRKNKNAKPADLELLARIKMYRERQEILPPSLWDGPGPHASEQDVEDHIQGPSRTQQGRELSGEESAKMSAAGSAAARLLDDLASQTPQQRLLPLQSDPSANQEQPEEMKKPNPARASTSGFGLANIGFNLRAFTKRKSSLDMIQQRIHSEIGANAGSGTRTTDTMTPSGSTSTTQSAHSGIVDSQRPQLSRMESDSSDPDAVFSSLMGRLQSPREMEAAAFHTRDASSHRSTLATATADSSTAGATNPSAQHPGAEIPRPESSFGVVCDSWSEQGDQDQGIETDDDDMPLGHLQMARLSRTGSTMGGNRRGRGARLSVVSAAETVMASGEDREWIRDEEQGEEKAEVLDRGARAGAEAGVGPVDGRQQAPVRRSTLTRSVSDDRLTRLDNSDRNLHVSANWPRPMSQHMISSSSGETTELMQQAQDSGLPYPRRPFTGGGGSIPRPASVGPGTLFSETALMNQGILGEGAMIEQDPYHVFPLGPSPFPVSMSPGGSPQAMRGGDLPASGRSSPFMRGPGGRPLSRLENLSGHVQQGSMSTKQLQALAKQATFPSSFGIYTEAGDAREGGIDEFGGADPLSPGGGADAGIQGIMDVKGGARKEGSRPKRESTFLKEEENEGIMSRLGLRRSRTASVLLDPIAIETGYAGTEQDDRPIEPILRQNGKIVLTPTFPAQGPPQLGPSSIPDFPRTASTASYAPTELATPRSALPIPAFNTWNHNALPGAVEPPAGARRPSVDDSFTSPPAKGPLKPLGLAAREPKALVMPAPLQGSEAAPQTRLTHDGVEISFEVTPPPAFEITVIPSEAGKKKEKEKKKKKEKKDVPEETLQGPRAPEGFVLHDVRGTAPLRALLVRSAAPAGSQIAQPTLSAKPKKHDVALANFLTSDDAARIVHVPAAAPSGIGRRAADKSTILFRNHLVQHEEEREGWGWDAASNVVDEHGQIVEPEGKKTRAERRAEKKALKIKRARQKARRRRRALRALADKEGKTYHEVGVEAESPVEDLDLSSDSTQSSDLEDESLSSDYDSDDEKRWVDENRPAGKLFGKSLLDMAEVKRDVIQKKSRFYGQTELEENQAIEREAERLGVSVDVLSSRTAARTIHEDPLGYNDTRERMKAAFGEDTLWSREMAKRKEEDAREAEQLELKRLADEEYEKAEKERKDRKKAKKAGRKGASQDEKPSAEAPKPPSKDGTPIIVLPEDGRFPDVEHDEWEEPPRSRTPIDPPTLDVEFNVMDDGTSKKGRRDQGPSEVAAGWFARSSDEDDDGETSSGSEDEAARRKAAMQRARMSRSLGGFGQGRVSFAFGEDESDEERREARQGGQPLTTDTNATRVGGLDDDSSGDDMPLAQLKKTIPPKSLADGLGARKLAGGGDDSSDEDLPLAAIKAKEHRKKMSMGALDLNFLAGDNAGRRKNEANQMSQPSSHSPSPQIIQAATMPATASWFNPAAHLPNAGFGNQYAAVPPPEDDEDSDDMRPLGAVYTNGAEALAAARAAHANSDEEDDEDNRPLGNAYPQAAIIAEQAALIQQLQQQNEQALRMANSMSMYGSLLGPPGMGMGLGSQMMNPQMSMGMGMGMGGGMGMGMGMGVPPQMGSPMGIPGPASVISGHGGGGDTSAAMTAPGIVHPKVHQIDNWRHSVHPDVANLDALRASPSPSAGRQM